MEKFKNTSICIGKSNSFSNTFFKQLMKKLNYNENDINIIEEDVFSKKTTDNFKNNLISALFLITPHPIFEIDNLHKQFDNISIIGTEGINDKIMVEFKNFKPSIIEINECGDIDIDNCASYKFKNNNSKFIKSYSIQSSLFSKEKISNKSILKLVKTILNNVENYSKNEPDNENKKRQLFLKQIYNKISKSDLIFYPKNIIHQGAKNYYKSIGLITNEKNTKCANYVDKIKCDKDVLERPHYGNASIGQILDDVSQTNKG